MGIQNAMTFLFMRLQGLFRGFLHSAGRPKCKPLMTQKEIHVKSVSQLLPLKKEVSTNYLLQVLGNKLELPSLSLKEPKSKLGTDIALF